MVYHFRPPLAELAEGFRGPLPGPVRLSVSGPLRDDRDGFRVFQLREPVENPHADHVKERILAEVLFENVEGFGGACLAEASRRLPFHVIASVPLIQDSYQSLSRVFIAKLS